MQVEIWSDIACPWCYVGKRRFEAALAAFEHRAEVELRWRSFELDPGAPPERSGDGASHLAAKYGTSRAEALAMQRRMTEAAAGDGLDFRFDIARGGNTFDAHRVLHLACARGVQGAVKGRLLSAYLSEGELMSDHDTLAGLATQAGLDGSEVREMLMSSAYAEEVRKDERTAAELGINAVPFFVVDRTFAASGAQPPNLLTGLLQQAWEARTAIPVPAVGGGQRCGPSGA
ncbi:MAG: DsbA family oxidoreductase [Solirubrobacteraceae bacterium]